MSSSIFITTVSATPVAPISASPYTFGYNLGHYLSNSNASDWFNYSRANGARMFVTPSRIYSTGSISTFNNTITSLTDFNNAKSAVRAAGENSTYINWNTYNTNIAAFTGIDINNYPNYIDLNYTLSDLNSKGIKTLISFDASINTFPILSSTNWSNMWLLWGNFYATSYLFAKNYNIKDWQMFNEPDLVGTNLPLSAWLLRLELTSDAIQSAVSDYNTIYKKSLSANVHAPVNSGGGSVRYTNSWGQSAIKTINTTYAGTTNPNYFNFVTFDYHKYSTLTSSTTSSLGFIDDLSATQAYLTNDGFSAMPIAISEYSARDAANYDSFVYTMDTASEYLFVAADSVALACNGINEMYLYKFGQTYRSGVGVTYPVFKNGTYYVSNSGSAAGVYGGASQGAEVYKLFNKALAGNASIVYKTYVNTVSSTMMTYNPSLENYYIYVVNETLGSIPLDSFYTTLPLSSFNTTSTPIFVEEVSQNCNGGGPLNNYLAFTELKGASLVPPQSVQLYTIPSRVVTLTTLPSISTIQLNDGIYSNTTFTNNPLVSSTQIIQVSASNLTDVNGRSVALIKFNGLQNFYNNNNVQNTYLDLTVTPSVSVQANSTISISATQIHVYGVNDSTWGNNATWNTSTNILKQNIPAGTQIANNIVNNQGSTTTILGQVVVPAMSGTYDGSYYTLSIDVSNFVKNNMANDSLSFLVTQDHRWDIALPSLSAGDLQPNGMNVLGIGSGEEPTLTFITKKPAGLFFQYVYPQGSTNYVTYNFGTGSGATANTILVDTLGTGMTATPISIGSGMGKVSDKNGLKVHSTSVGGWKDTIPQALAGNQFFYWTLSASNPSFNYINSFGDPSVYLFNVRRTISGPQKAALLASSDPNFGSYSTLCNVTLSTAGPNYSLTSSINSWFGNNVGVINYWPVYFRLVPYFNIGQGGSYYFELQHTGGTGTVDDLSIQYFTNSTPGTNVPSLSMT